MKKVSWILALAIVAITVISVINNRVGHPDFLEKELNVIESYFSQREVTNKAVSQADVAWHLDHILKTINRISKDLISSDPDGFTPRFNVQRVMIHTTGIIPRGVAQSPPGTVPPDVILPDSLRLQLARARENLNSISALEEGAYFAHPVFDHLDRDQARRFIQIHTRHHLKIIREILGE